MAVAISGLLFLAFAFFAVAQAGSVRNGGQSAADAAAVGAANQDREDLLEGFLEAVANEDDLEEWLSGEADIPGDGCSEASYFADRNDSNMQGCDAIVREANPGYSVDVRTRFDTGDSVVPGAANKTAKASATAVVMPLCTVEDPDEITLMCDGEEITVDPDEDDPDIEPADLYKVALVD